ncbi:MAG: thiamine-phosphate kinase, partial [Bacteroidota bacterium]|nr:thiamine-phosphate kinase [Bacteroidota bacterium]
NNITKNSSTITSIGDDAAVIDNKGKLTLVSTDMLIEGVHFDLTFYPLKHLGYKIAVSNFSDIYAMNGTPKQITVSIAISNRFSVEAVDELYSGIQLACKKYKVDLVGGDTSASPHGLFLSITVVGEVEKEDVVHRNGAKENDLLCVSGDLGAAYVGLLVLEREKQAFKADPNMQPDLSGNDYILERQLKPEAREDILHLLKENDIKPTSMIDISDGLASEALHLCTESKVGCAIYEEKIPIDYSTEEMAKEFNIAPTVAALNGGEDFELLFTIDQNDYKKVQDLDAITVVGHMTDIRSSATLITKDGISGPLTAQGWDALLTKEKEVKKDDNTASE